MNLRLAWIKKHAHENGGMASLEFIAKPCLRNSKPGGHTSKILILVFFSPCYGEKLKQFSGLLQVQSLACCRQAFLLL